MTPRTRGEYSVFQWFIDGSREDVLRFVGAEEAVDTATRLATSVGGRLGSTQKIMITDGGDCCCWEWNHEKGMTFPTEFKGRLKKGVR